MNEFTARQMGYEFHGAYSHDKEEMKTRAKELRALGNKAVVVNTPPSKYSRGHSGMGYSVYWIESPENARTRKIENIKRELDVEYQRHDDAVLQAKNATKAIDEKLQILKDLEATA